MSEMRTSGQPLSGIRVLELSGQWTGCCGRLLCDLGAEVLLVEPPGGSVAREAGPFFSDKPGPDRSISFWYDNAGKSGFTFNLDIPSDRERLLQLVRSCDILVESCAPGRLDAAGLGYEALSQINPALIMASITGFGLTGPYSGYKSCGLVASAAGGQMYVSGLPGRQPLQPYGDQPYHLASLFAACGILIALRWRVLTGRGQHIDISLQEAAAAALEHVLVQYFHDKVIARRRGSLQWNAASDLFPCRDGYLLLTFNREWDTLVELLRNREMAAELGQPAWKDEDYRRQHIEDIQEVLTFWTCQQHKEDLFRLGQDMRFPWAPVGSVADTLHNPQLRARGFFVPASHPLAERGFEVPRPVIVIQNDENCGGGLQNPPAAAAPDGMPLQGIRVLDFTWMLAGPYATRLLADFGAEVIKVQSRQTATGAEDNKTGYFAAWNRNKLGITLNLSSPEARHIVADLIGKCDIVMENFTPRVMRNWGLDYDRLREVNPKLVMVSLSGFGRGGPWENYAALGSTVQALSGLTGLTSYREGRPCGIGFALADHISGLYAALAALSALRRRDATGSGAYIEISELEAACSTLAPELIHLSLDGSAVGPQGNSPSRETAAPYGSYACKGDDRWCVIAVHNDEEWRSLCRAMGDPDWTKQERFSGLHARRENVVELDGLIGEWTRTRTNCEVMRILQDTGVPAAAVNDASDLTADPHLCQRGFFVDLQHPYLGRIRADGNPVRMSAAPARYRSASPLLGADNRRVFLELLGMDEERFSRLVSQGIIG